jgi:CheY-like chemotaxis protein
MHLHNLIADRKSELLGRSRAKLEGSSAYELDYWLPVLLDLLAEALESDAHHPQARPGEAAADSPILERPGPPGDAILEHPMRRLGITLERVSRDCVALEQAIIELAFEEHSSLSASQCHALDRCVARVVAGARAGCQNVQERVVVVETDRQVRGLMQRFVGDIYLLEFHDDGASALDHVRSEAPSLLITEILVPRLDGLTLCRLLKTDRATARVPILVYSVLAAEHRARQFGADAFFEKPLEKTRLLASMRELTSRGPAPQPHDVAAQ